jgi:type I restriction enzyme M protein
LQAEAKQPTIGQTLDAAMAAIEHHNPRLRGVLPKDYGRPALDKRRLGELIDLIGTVGLGDSGNRSRDILGRVYEYFLGQFASAEGKNSGEFYTPRPVVRLLVEMLEPRAGARIYDPCCGSGGMFVQSEKFVEEHGGRRGAVSIFGQELNHTTWRMCQMNLAIRGIEARIEQGDTFHAGILGELDDKTELNRRMTETLEGIARTVFKSWFVDFDPVRAKAEGRQPAGIDAEWC